MARKLSETERRALHARIRADSRRIVAEHLQATGRGEQARALLERHTPRSAPPANRTRFATEAEMRALLSSSVDQAMKRRAVAEQAAPPAAPTEPEPPTVEELATLNTEQWKAHSAAHWSEVFAAQDARRPRR